MSFEETLRDRLRRADGAMPSATLSWGDTFARARRGRTIYRAVCAAAVLALVVAGAVSVRTIRSERVEPPPVVPADTPTVDATADPTEGDKERCSASGLDATVTDDPELPAAVDAVRREIVVAAVACDYEALAGIASRGDQRFTYTTSAVDEANDPAGFWEDLEKNGAKPLEQLVRIIKGPYVSGAATYPGDSELRDRYVWPAVYRNDRPPTKSEWDAFIELDVYARAEVEAMMGPNDGYRGYWIEIGRDGEWLAWAETH